MQFKLFPVNAEKMPCLKGWQQAATTDQETLNLWSNLYRDQMTHWGIPTGQGIIVLDADAKDGGLETLKTLSTPETMWQRTRSGGVHLFYRYHVNGRHYGNRVKFLPGLDIRAEGGYVVYYGATNLPIAEAPQWLLDAAANNQTFDHSSPTISVSPTLAQGIIEKAIDNIRNAPQGERNNTLNTEAFRIGQLVQSQSITKEFAEASLMKAAAECGLSTWESKTTIASAMHGGSKKPLTSPFGEPIASISIPPPPGPVARWTPQAFTENDIMDFSKLKSPQLFEDWSTEDIHIMTADGGTGKTTMMLEESICLALGHRFLGFDCKQKGRTLYITGEDDEQKLAARIGTIVRQMKLNKEQIKNVLDSVIVKKDPDLCLIMKDRQGFLHPNEAAMARILEAVHDFQPKMMVFDPISMFWGSEAGVNDMAKAVSKFMAKLASHRICVVMINHMGKASSSMKDMTQFAGRGGTGLPSHSRVSRVLREVDSDEYKELTGETLDDGKTAMMCKITKFSDGSPLYNKPFLIIREGFLFSRLMLSKTKEIELEKQMNDLEKVFTFVKEERRMNRYPSKNVIITHFNTCGDPLSEKRVKGALDMLQYQGHIGEKLKFVENPDATVRDRVYVITDIEGRENLVNEAR